MVVPKVNIDAASQSKVARPEKRIKRTEPGSAQEGLEYTWQLQGCLKMAQKHFLRIGKLLTEVREKNLFVALKHKDMEDYADARLGLGKTSLYKYINVYNWVRENHPEWLQPKPKGFIPDLSDIDDMRWIEEELKRPDLTTTKKAALEALDKKALAGDLRKGEITPLRRRTRTDVDCTKAFLSKLRRLRKQGAALKGLPPGVISDLDSAIEKMAS